MRDERLTHRRLFGDTPQDFTWRIHKTLTGLTEERNMKKGISFVLAMAVVLTLLCAAAFAAVNGVGLDWFYKNIFHSPMLPENVDQIIQNNILDSAEHPLLDLKVQSAVWLPKGNDRNFPDSRLLEILVSIRPKDSDKYEVHAWDTMNNDGYREKRSEDHITTLKGTGPVMQKMQDPNKTLLLYGKQPITYLIDGSHSIGLGPGLHIYDYDPVGNLLAYISYPVSDDVYASIRSIYADADNNVTIHYRDESWLWNAQGAEYGLTQSGCVTFTIKLPD